MDEVHKVSYEGHLGYQNTITTITRQYFWLGMKKDIVEYIEICMECQKVKVEHGHPA